MGVPSSIGYGHNPFGHPHGGSPFKQGGSHPYSMNVGYGVGDWAEEVTWSITPEWMRDEDGQEGDVPEPLRGFIDAVKPILNWLNVKWRDFPTLWDATECPIDQLPALAYTVGITLDTTKSEALQRTEVLNAPQLFVHKGTDKGYSILASFEDLTVEIIPLWSRGDPETLSTTSPIAWTPHFDDLPADHRPLDASFDDPYAIWPVTLWSEEAKRSHSLRLIFYPTDDPTQDFDADVATRIAQRLLRYKPIHVNIDRLTFDGLRGSSQAWIGSVVADSTAVGMWIGPVTGEQRASSQTWVQAITAEPTP